MRFQRVSERMVPDDSVVIASSSTLPLENASFLQLADDPLHGALRDAHPHGHFAQGSLRTLNQADQYMSLP